MVTDDYDRIVRAQVIDVAATNQNERLMNPQWGCNLQAAVFEQSDGLERSDLGNYTTQRINSLLPRADVARTKVTASVQEPNVVYIGIDYRSSPYSPERTAEVRFDSTDGA